MKNFWGFLLLLFLIAIILRICNDRRILGTYVNTRWQNFWGGLTLLCMTAAAIGLLVVGM